MSEIVSLIICYNVDGLSNLYDTDSLPCYVNQAECFKLFHCCNSYLFSYQVCGRCVQCKNCGKRTAGEVSCLLPLNYFVDWIKSVVFC